MFDVRNFNLICVLQNPVRADFQPLIADTQFYKYVYELVGRTVWTHELGDPKLVERIRKLSKPDFIKMCEEEDID